MCGLLWKKCSEVIFEMRLSGVDQRRIATPENMVRSTIRSISSTKELAIHSIPNLPTTIRNTLIDILGLVNPMDGSIGKRTRLVLVGVPPAALGSGQSHRRRDAIGGGLKKKSMSSSGRDASFLRGPESLSSKDIS